MLSRLELELPREDSIKTHLVFWDGRQLLLYYELLLTSYWLVAISYLLVVVASSSRAVFLEEIR